MRFTTSATPDFYNTLIEAAQDLEYQSLAGTIYDENGKPVAMVGPDGFIEY